ncbi:MAG: energy-coupled thiamine transporter ThiT [Oscillibacter sp.]|nr:energy-coupled thiamine transporter ThiT [Oscillibacter sp.]
MEGNKGGRAAVRRNLRRLVEGAVMVAIAQVLSMIILGKLPQGGSVCLGMLPIFLYSVRWGAGAGLMSGFALGVLQFLSDGGIALGWQSIIGDYLVAFTVLGVAGVFRGRKYGVYFGTVAGSAARFLVHYVVGATIWREYMPDVFFGLTMTSPWFYSLLYNGSYMLIDMALCLLVFALLQKPMGKYLAGDDIRA